MPIDVFPSPNNIPCSTIQSLLDADTSLYTSAFRLSCFASEIPSKAEEAKANFKICGDLLWNSRTVAGTIIGGGSALEDIVPALLHDDLPSSDKIAIVERWYQLVSQDRRDILPHFEAITTFEADIREYAAGLRSERALSNNPLDRAVDQRQDAFSRESAQCDGKHEKHRNGWSRLRSFVSNFTSKEPVASTQTRKPFKRFSQTFAKLWATIATLVTPCSRSDTTIPPTAGVYGVPSSNAGCGACPPWTTSLPIQAAQCSHEELHCTTLSIADHAKNFRIKLEVILGAYSEFSQYHAQVLNILNESNESQIANLRGLLCRPSASLKSLENYARSAPILRL